MNNKARNNYHKLPILDGLELLDAKDHNINFPFHTHDTFNITLSIAQTFSTKLTDRLLHTNAGYITITNPGEVHSTICDTKTGSSFFTFYVSPDVMKVLNDDKDVFFVDKIIDNSSLFSQLKNLSGKLISDPAAFEKEFLQAMQQLLDSHAAEKYKDDTQGQLFQNFLQEDNINKFSLETTAGKFGLDKFKFLRLFKQYTGLTPNNYVILRRIERSKTLLLTGDDLLGIAIESGFYDATHFCKHFKKVTGVTPMAYRNAMLCNIVL